MYYFSHIELNKMFESNPKNINKLKEIKTYVIKRRDCFFIQK